ncbi:MAG TPA: lamin tail domain-containing protein [Tepidisphaeraceae bacterium]|nr:lamin tail domain-containing protein [Tepidisphaeraceae bacterium]
MRKTCESHQRCRAHLRRACIDVLEPRLLLANISINEILAVNVNNLTDEDNDHSDWVELRNSSGSAQNLNGFYLTDDPANLNKWQFPDVSIPANGYLIVFASDKDRAVAGSPLHTNFNLDRNGETLLLVNPDGATIESQLTFGEQEEDVSFGPDPGTTGNPLRDFAQPTPLAANVRSEVIINEIHYDPYVKTEQVEFIELYNPSPIAVSLSGAYFSAGIDYAFPAGTSIAPGQYLVLAENPAQFMAKFKSTPFAGYSGSLSNDGETITLRNAVGGKLERVDYGAGFPWPTVGELPGNSIQLINPNFDNGLGGNWRSAAPSVGPASTPTSTTIFASGGSWRYRKGSSEASNPIDAWRQNGFVEDATWLTGNGPIGYDPTVVMGTTLADMKKNTAGGIPGYASVFLHKTFNIANINTIGTLRLEAMYDDAFSVWINGQLVYRTTDLQYGLNAAGELTNSSLCNCVPRESSTYSPIYLPIPQTYLQNGSNLISIQYHNNALDDADAYFDARLISTPYIAAGLQNTNFAANAPPQMRQVENFPKMPTSNVPVTITAKITDPNGVQSATLKYQLVDPGSYIAITDAAYATSWTNLDMHDDGLNGDVTAGDGTYTVVMPASFQVHRRLIRYRISTTDTLGATITAPYADDEQPNFAYYIYNGVPSWTGAARPGVTPNVTYNSTLMNSMPVYQLISKQTDVESSTWYSKYTGEDYLWRGTLIYDGEVYDHIAYRARGGVWRYSMGKNMWKFDFNRNHGFQARDDYGNPYPTKWDKLNFSAIIQQGNFWHRGEQGLFESVGFKLFNLAGVAGPATNFVQFRIVDNAAENGATQYDGDLWGMYLAMEQQDGNLLDQHDLPDGNLYKMETGPGGGISNNQGPDQPSDNSDLINFTNTYTNTTPTDDWWRQNLDLEEYYSYRSTVESFHHYDIGNGKNYFYYHNPQTNKWEVLPWDLDLTWADNMCCSDNEPFKSRVLPRAAFNLEYQNRLRELRDLLFNPDQMGQVIDEMAAKIYTPGQPSWVDIDRAMWDYNPTMIDAAKVPIGNDKAGQGRFYAGNPSQGIVIPAPGGFAGMVQKLKNYIVSRDSFIDTTLLTDTTMPNKPTVTYTGPALYPIDGLTFNSSNFSDSTGTFAAMKWRIARITNPAAPGYDPKAPKFYEINASWESPEITTFANGITIPPQVVDAGNWYRVRVKMKDSTGRWSKWSDAVQFQAGPSPSKVKDSLRITEIAYNPSSPPPTAEFQQNDDYEFIEIKNIGLQVINLNGANFSAGIDYTFGDISLSPGESLVLAKNPDAFASRYDTTGMKIAPLGYTGLLDNGGEQLILKDGLGQTILNFTYDDAWYPTTDGGDFTLQIIDPLAATGTWNNSTAWRASLYVDGTPGADEETLAQGSVVINEVLNNSELAGDWIELYNTTGFPINIGGWYISDMPSQPAKFRIPSGTTIPANGYLVFTELEDFNNAADPGALVPFAFNDSGDDAVISSANSFGVISGYDHEIHFDASDPQVTLGRYTNSGGSAFAATSSPTPGAANSAPRVGPIIINEIMYNPPLGGDEFVELLNITNAAVDLFDPANPANTWKFTRGLTFSFPQGVSVPAGGYMLLVAIDPATFRSKYSIPISVPIYQYTGLLDNNGETLSLGKPTTPEIDLTVPYIEIDRVDYDNVAPWPTTPAGGGASLGKTSPVLYGNDPVSWEPESNGGTPGALHNDTNPPLADIVDVTPDPRTTAVPSIIINFTEPVLNFDLSDLVLTRNGGTNLLTDQQTLATSNNTSFTLGNLSPITWVEGAYTLTLNSSNITDLTGHPLTTNPTDSFTVSSSTLNPGNNPAAYVLKMHGSDLDIFENNPGPNPTYRVKMSDLLSLTINTGGSADSLTLDYANGNPLPSGGLFFNGGAGSDTLTILGAPGSTATTYRPSGTTTGNGIVSIAGRNLTFTGMEPVSFRNLTSFTFVTPNATDTVTIDSPASPPGQTRIFGNSSGITFFSISIFATPLMILDAATNDGGAGNDSLTIGSSGTNTSATTSLRILTGAGADTLAVNGGVNYLDLPPSSSNLSANINGAATINLSGAPRLASLSINDTARVNLLAGGANSLKLGSSTSATPLQISSTATLDLADNDLLIQTSIPARDTAFAAYLNMVISGRNGGAWDGKGIISSTAASNPLHNTTLAIMPNDTGAGPIVTTFAGQTVDTTFNLIKYTYTGDMDLDGDIDADDYARLDAAYAGATGIGGPYRNGDINYSGSINSDDYFQIDRAFSTQGAVLSPPQAPAAAAAISATPTRQLHSGPGTKRPGTSGLRTSGPGTKRHHHRHRAHQPLSRPPLLPPVLRSLFV